jgi:KaiC/GvpD/RAD55 family RecA-like ATPase
MADELENRYLELSKPALLAILGHCICTPSFLRNCAKTLTKEHLRDIMIADMYDFVISYYKKYDKGPTRAECESYLSQKFSDVHSLNSYRGLLYEAIDLQVKNFRVEALSEEIGAWLRTLVMRNVFVRGGALFNKSNYLEAQKLIFEMQGKLKDAAFDKDERVNMDDMEEIITNVLVNRGKACTLGHPEFDELIMTGAKIPKSDPRYDESKIEGMTKGSLLPGEITILMGPINSGKTTTISTVAVANVMMGKKVCVVGCEDPKNKMALKFMQSFCQKTQGELSFTKSEEFIRINKAWSALSADKLHYFEWIKPGKMFVEDIIDLVENAQERAIAKDGKGFDLLIVDYPGLLDSRVSRAKDIWDVKRHIYSQLRLLGVKNEFHVLTPIQTNREGFKLNTTAERLLDMGDVAQGFGIVSDADNVITINRTPEDHANFRIKYYVAKTRSGEAKRAFISEVRYDLGRTHGIGYGFAVYDVMDIKNIADEEALTKRLRRIMTANMQAIRNPDKVAYNQAPPLDKAQQATPVLPLPNRPMPTPLATGNVVPPTQGTGFDVPVDINDLPAHLRPK